MKKIKSIVFLATLAGYMTSTATLFAQKGRYQLGVVAEASIAKDAKAGFGGHLKGALRVHASSQLTIQAGVSQFNAQIQYISPNGDKVTENELRLIPVLLGYKRFINQFYLEPQAGFGELRNKIELPNPSSEGSTSALPAFYWAVGSGYQFSKVDIGIRYQRGQATRGQRSRIWDRHSASYIGLHVGYYFTCK